MSNRDVQRTAKDASITQEQIAHDFDRLVEDYESKINTAIAFGGREHTFYIDVKRKQILDRIGHHLGETTNLDVLDLGCGLGGYHAGLEGRFRELHGVDVSPRSIDFAEQKHPWVQYKSFDGGSMPYEDARFDAVFTVCVMHHVPPSQWTEFTAEMRRVLKPGGLALVFEHNPYNPATQFIVKSCEIDRDAVLLRPGKLRALFRAGGFKEVATRSILSVPPVGVLSYVDRALGLLPFGAQYFLSALK